MADPAAATSSIHDAVCLACGCLCDDIDLVVSSEKIVEAHRACPIGASWFLQNPAPNTVIAALDKAPVSQQIAIDRACEILRASRSPLIFGLTQTTIETQREAVALADRTGAYIDPLGETDSLPRWRAIQNVGIVSATLGEVRNRADVIVYWGADPLSTHPRHLERYTIGATGRFVERRRLIVVDKVKTKTAETADLFVQLPPAEYGESLSTLRMLAREINPGDCNPALRPVAEVLKSARYGAFFLGVGLQKSADLEEALKLVRDLNHSRRFVALTMGGPGNGGGAEAVLSWQTGSPRAISFAAGFPRYLPEGVSAERLLARGEVDAAVIVADGSTNSLSPAAVAHLQSIPRIVIRPNATSTDAAVAMNCGVTGIHTSGTVMRCDGAVLPLQTAIRSTLPTDREWLITIREQLEGVKP